MTRESSAALAGTWVAFLAALVLALPQPPRPLHVAIGAVAGAALIALGFAAAGRCRPLTRRPDHRPAVLLLAATAAGALMGGVLLVALVLVVRRVPELAARFADRAGEPAWRPLALAFESSILEEVVFRLFAMSAVAWVAGRILRGGRAPWLVALAVSALLFGMAHLPAWLAATAATPALVAGVLVLNGTAGVLMGWIFWRWGLPAAILCHCAGDLVIQGLGPRLLG